MAEKTLEQLRDELTAITEENRKAYDAFNQRGYTTDGRSLKQAYEIAIRRKNTEDIAKYKPLYEAAQVEYKKTQTKKNELAKAVKAAETAEKETKTKEKAASAASDVYDKALKKLSDAEINLAGYQGEEKYNTAYQEAFNAYNAAVTAGKNPKPLPAPKTSTNFQQSPAPGGTVSGQPNTGSNAAPENFAEMASTARKYVKSTLDNAGRLQLATSLRDAGINVPLTGEFTDALVQGYQQAINAAKGAYGVNKEFPTVAAFLADQIRQSNAIKAAGGGTGSATDVAINLSSDTDAQSLIQSTFKSVLGRDATAAELSSFTKQLNKAERAAGRKATKVGNRTTYTSDLNREQFLTNEIKKIVDPKSGKSEFETKRAEKEGLTAQSLQAVAKLNGINLSQAQLDAYATDIRNGKDINVIKNNIRQMAGLGRPDSIKKLLAEGTDLDTIYSPYKTTMASILEVPVDQIDLNDATLQGAIGPDKEMPLYEFRKALKKDNRWQYTNNARKEVSDNVLRVLQDFGFQG